MENPPNQPREYDAILGGQNLLPSTGDMVLGETEKLIQQGIARFAIGDYQGAIQLQINPNKANAYSNRGMARYKLGDYLGAINDFNQSLQIESNSAATHNRGIARSAIGDKQGAMEDLHKAAELFVRQRDIHHYKQALSMFIAVESSRLIVGTRREPS